MQTYRDVIDRWPDRETLASDVGANKEAVRKWWERDRIAPEYWDALVRASALRGIKGITPAKLMGIAAAQRRPSSQAAE